MDKDSVGEVLFHVQLTGREDEIVVLDAETREIAATLYDDGEDGDAQERDGIYSGFAKVDTSEIGEHRFFAIRDGYVKSQPVTVTIMEPLTEEDIIDIQTVDDTLGENILNIENYNRLSSPERRELADSVISGLLSDGLITDPVEYNEDNYSYTFTYRCGRPGFFELGAPGGSYLVNGDLETEPELTGWEHSGNARIAYGIGGVNPVKGDKMAMISTGGGADESYISQTVTIPQDTVRLSFYFNMYSETRCITSQDTFTVEVIAPSGTNTLLAKRASSSTWFGIDHTASDADITYHTGWEWREYDISRFAGEAVTIRFKMSGGGSRVTRALIDAISLSNCGISSCTADEVVTLAFSQLGITEWPYDSNNVKYNTAYYGKEVNGSYYSWCCAFTWWLFDQNNANSLFFGGNRTASCTELMNYAKDNGLWVSGAQRLRPGDLLLYNFDRYADADHIGVFIGYDENGDLLAIEGNTSIGNDDNGGAVMIRIRKPGVVLGAYRPEYMDAPIVYDENFID